MTKSWEYVEVLAVAVKLHGVGVEGREQFISKIIYLYQREIKKYCRRSCDFLFLEGKYLKKLWLSPVHENILSLLPLATLSGLEITEAIT